MEIRLREVERLVSDQKTNMKNSNTQKLEYEYLYNINYIIKYFGRICTMFDTHDTLLRFMLDPTNS